MSDELKAGMAIGFMIGFVFGVCFCLDQALKQIQGVSDDFKYICSDFKPVEIRK